ncbi:P-loop NTPase fold protein [Pseudobutyrivibrio xylanivorans]|uniref:KAP family P-loop domain-containing protein n=1 Tax=Pseudobutyrivibrio xylanivorans DSM 14809 TaxID=1123012 RepID=A0A1M6E1Y2_PSEXY|nr:P-loop NTPase fold protein [Pseudobutyrivibrio xylanivorans]SHI79496.1 KAP family P-loop domain-containing protein [Pseudobutyrivibrio xylanivorans DSM 14809]
MEKDYIEDLGAGMLLNTDFIKKIANNEVDGIAEAELFNEELINKKEAILNMLDTDIPFCALVSGFRGTGKSVFVDYIFSDCHIDDKEIVVVKFNTSNYKNFADFLRKIIRELYVAVGRNEKEEDKKKRIFAIRKNKDDKEDNSLKNLYISTFYDVKESSNILIQNSKKKSINFESALNVVADLSKWAELAVLLALTRIPDEDRRLQAFFILGIISVALNLTLDFTINKEKVSLKQNEYNRTLETLYDDETIEYRLLEQLEKLYNAGKRVVLVIDELDKLDSDSVNQILCDIKPLLLSKYSNSILVGGLNFEMVGLLSQQDNNEEKHNQLEMNSVGADLYNHKLYMRLAYLSELNDIADVLMNPIPEEEIIYENTIYDTFLKIKAIEARGIKRAFVNSIVNIARGKYKELYLCEEDISDYNYYHKELLKYYNAIEKLENALAQKYDDSENLYQDISLKYGYYFIDYYERDETITTISVEDMREELDAFLPKQDANIICRMLSEADRQEIIETMVNNLGGSEESNETNEPKGPDGPITPITPISSDMSASGKTELPATDYMMGNSSLIETSLENDLQQIISVFEKYGFALKNKEKRQLNELYRLIVLFAGNLGKTISDFCAEVMSYLPISKEDKYKEESNAYRLLVKCFSLSNLSIEFFAGILMKSWYLNVVPHNELVSEKELYLDEYGLKYCIADYADEQGSRAFDVKYYRSNSYLEGNLKSLKNQFKMHLRGAFNEKIYRLAFVIFVYDSYMDKKCVLQKEEVGDTVGKIIVVNLYSVDSFTNGMTELRDFLFGEQDGIITNDANNNDDSEAE